ncbi:pentapeptide repeat-containing protein [Paracoccus zhejiangensis]|uniref:Pentapeptide repeat-containing protein n=1 Tax=Paracoccus zhejiangensis TaxID=1077935 RepID=A0A2H5EUU0_9RHOB|nr:pentapeptide repeat-containing protein [Paracoccus zhejiangensis]AUH63065.1 hypothetical protein CX676_01910 [Paracoccus zhejiangensis]
MSRGPALNMRLSKRRRSRAGGDGEGRSDPAEIARIDALIRTCRTNWFLLMSYLAFVGVTLIGVVDLDFFIPERRTELPLIGVTIPTSLFFYIAPVLGVMLYAHLHFYLFRLWRALSSEGAPSAEMLSPWVVVDFALYVRGRRGYRYPLQWLVNLVVLVLIFLATPIVLTAFWWWSMPKHDGLLTIIFCGVPLFLSILVCVESWWVLRRGVGQVKVQRRRSLATDFLLGLGLVSIPILGFARSVNMWPWPNGETLWPTLLARAELNGAVLVETPEDWLPRDRAELGFRTKWCAGQGFSTSECGPGPIADTDQPEFLLHQRQIWCDRVFSPAKRGNLAVCISHFEVLDQSYEADWNRARDDALSLLQKRNLSNADLRHARLEGARLEGANLRNARLEGANLWDARLEGANLRDARLEGADLRGARLEGADLTQARLERADLRDARLEGADLTLARLERADLRDARLEGADLTLARLERAILLGARLEGANLNTASLRGAALRSADLTTAVDLTADQIGSFFGDASVILPEKFRPPPAHWPDWVLDFETSSSEYRRWRANPSTYTPPRPRGR